MQQGHVDFYAGGQRDTMEVRDSACCKLSPLVFFLSCSFIACFKPLYGFKSVNLQAPIYLLQVDSIQQCSFSYAFDTLGELFDDVEKSLFLSKL